MDFSKFQDKADLVNEEIQRLLDGEPETIYKAAKHVILAGGKRIRPILCMLSSEAVGGKAEDALKSAVAIELIHSFTLIHDDIMDNDDLRRGVPSTHKVYGNSTAILAGDLLFAKAFEICDPEVVKILANTTSKISEGQEMDLSFESQKDVQESDYLEMIRKKTASLIEASTKAGATIAQGNEKEINALGDFGLNIGMAFQIHDDVLDISGEEENLGKPVGSDIEESKKNLVIISAMKLLEGEGRENLRDILTGKDNSKADIEGAIDLIQNSGGVEYCTKKAEEFIQLAKDSLDMIPDSKAKKDLLKIADFIIKRNM